MFLLGFSLAALLFVASIALGGWDKLVVFWDTPSVAWVLLCVLLHILLWGRPYFLTGMAAIFRMPKTGDPAVSRYFRRLTVWTVGVGIVGMLYGGALAIFLLNNPDIIGYALAFMLLTFCYAACLAMMVFYPIAVRFSVDSETITSKPTTRFPVALTILGLAAFFLTRASMAIVLVTFTSDPDNVPVFPAAEDIDLFLEQAVLKFNPGDFYGTLYNYSHPQMYWDFPSLVLVAGWLWAFRLSAGKPKNRFEWIPVAIIYGILGSITGMVLMLCDLDPELFGAGCMVALLTAFYGLVAAVFFAIGSWPLFWSFFLAFPVIAFTWSVPRLFLVPFNTPETPALQTETFVIGFFVAYGVFLYLFFRNAILAVRELEQWFRKPQTTAGPLAPEEEEAQKILDSAVEKQKR